MGLPSPHANWHTIIISICAWNNYLIASLSYWSSLIFENLRAPLVHVKLLEWVEHLVTILISIPCYATSTQIRTVSKWEEAESVINKQKVLFLFLVSKMLTDEVFNEMVLVLGKLSVSWYGWHTWVFSRLFLSWPDNKFGRGDVESHTLVVYLSLLLNDLLKTWVFSVSRVS
jgi:hypothetical protein